MANKTINELTGVSTTVDADQFPVWRDAEGDTRKITKGDLLGSVTADSILSADAKTTPVNADSVPLIDSEDSNELKRVTWANVKATLKTYFDTLYELAGAIATHAAVTATHGATGAVVGTTNAQALSSKTLDSTNIANLTAKNPPIDADSVVLVDSAASSVFKRVTYTNVKAFLKTYFDTLYGALATINTWALVQTFTSGINLGNTTLTNYTQGTWTPVATFNGSSASVTYSLQSGTYTRIGNRCFCTLHLALTNNGSGSGAFEITGLPFASSQQSAFPMLWGTTSTSFVNVMAIILSGTTTIGVYRITAAAASFTQMSDVEAGNTIGLNVEFSYRVA
jgi:hypothetical protein